MNILEAMRDDALFGKTFKRRLSHGDNGDSWRAWRAFLAALFGLPLAGEQPELYRKHTARTDPPSSPASEAFVIAGRRSGKSLIAALVAVFLACFRDYSGVLAPGETGVIMVLASDRRQARVVLGYINAFLEIPILARIVASRLKESIELSNRIRIEIHTSSFRATRGYTIVAAICDEIAFWPTDDSANPDTEVLTALRPGMVTVPGALLLCISSPYARRGALWEAYRQHFGKPDASTLVWQAETRAMNPTVSRLVIEAAYLRDHAAAAAEYGAQFRTDVEGFIPLEVVEARVIPSRFELPPLGDVTYTAFCDPSGGQSDAMTLAIAHVQDNRAVLDLLREAAPPFSPEQVVAAFADVLKQYRVSTVVGDRYAGEWPREQFSKRGIEYRPAEKNRSELYLELLPALMSGQVELLDNKRLVTQLVDLERRTARGGRDSVDHSPGAHDDLANATAGVAEALRGTSHVYGCLDWFESVASGLLSPDGTPKTPAPVVPPAIATAPPGTCECGWTGRLQIIAGGQNRCPHCGHQSWPAGVTPNVTTIGPTRGDVVGRGSRFIFDEFPTSPSMAERLKTLRRFR